MWGSGRRVATRTEEDAKRWLEDRLDGGGPPRWRRSAHLWWVAAVIALLVIGVATGSLTA